MKDSIRPLFLEHADALAEVSRSARKAEALIETISPLIEAYTSAVCPQCTTVCCINRHSRFDRSDVIFMTALGRALPEEDPSIADTADCRFLGSRGCRRKRPDRPYRCTWFFCSALLDQIILQTSASEFRRFMELLRNITEDRSAMMNDFETISAKLSGSVNACKR